MFNRLIRQACNKVIFIFQTSFYIFAFLVCIETEGHFINLPNAFYNKCDVMCLHLFLSLVISPRVSISLLSVNSFIRNEVFFIFVGCVSSWFKLTRSDS